MIAVTMIAVFAPDDRRTSVSGERRDRDRLGRVSASVSDVVSRIRGGGAMVTIGSTDGSSARATRGTLTETASDNARSDAVNR